MNSRVSALLDKDFYTSELIADRWGTDVSAVDQLVFTRRLAQAFVLSGPARLFLRNTGGSLELHPNTISSYVQTRLLVSALHSAADTFRWSLTYVLQVYEFVLGGVPRSSILEELLRSDSQRAFAYIEFHACETEIIGQSSIIVATTDLEKFESDHGISPKSDREQQDARQLRDTRKSRCRAIAQLLWERDPSATLPDIHKHEWIQRIACEGKPPVEKTFREWVKDLNPDRSPGRRSA